VSKTPPRGTPAEVAKIVGRHVNAVYRWIANTRDTEPNPLGLQESQTGFTLDVEKTRAYAAARRTGRPRKGQGA
jgi:hypothetical protein